MASPQQCPQDTKPGVKIGPYKSDYPWGNSATTCNIVNANVDMTTTMNNAVYNESVQSGSNTIILAGKCDPTVETCGTYKVGGTVNQTNSMKQTVASASYISNSAQQKAALAVAQQAVSQTKGIAPLNNSSTATNVANLSARLNIAMTNTTAQRCSQTASNVVVVDPSDYPDVDIEATINQTNDFSQKCIQLAVDRNVASQTVVAAVSQRAYASATGIPLWLVAVIFGLIVLGFFGTVWLTIENPSSIVFIMGAVFFCVGAVFFILYGITFNYAYLPYGYSPGLADATASCPDGGYTKLKDPKTFASYSKALAQCKKDSNCTAFDWVLDPEANDGSGTSTEYKGGVRRADKACPKITGYTDSDQSVSDADSGTAPTLMYIRPPAFRNVSLGNNPPDSSIVADVIMNVDTGDIWYKMPLPYTTCTGYKTPIDNTDAWNTWVFAKPSVMEVTMASNAFDWVSACSTTKGTACTSDTGSVCTITPAVKDLPPTTSADRPRVFFWIDPAQTIDLELDPASVPTAWKNSAGMNRSLVYKDFMTVGGGSTLAQTPGPEYKYDYTSPVGYTEGAGGDKFVPAKAPAKGDYFLVPFPYSPAATVDMSGWFPGGCDGKAKNPDTGTTCTWPPPGSVSGTSQGAPPSIVKSSFGAVYYLFPAIEAKDGDGKVTGDIVPDWSNGQPASAGYNEQWPASPLNMVMGYGIYLGTDAYTTTTLKVGTRIQPYLYVGGASILAGIALFAIGFMWTPEKAAAAAADGVAGPYGDGSIPCPLNGIVPDGSGNRCNPGELIHPPSAPPLPLQLPYSGDGGPPSLSPYPLTHLPYSYNGGGGGGGNVYHPSPFPSFPPQPPQSYNGGGGGGNVYHPSPFPSSPPQPPQSYNGGGEGGGTLYPPSHPFPPQPPQSYTGGGEGGGAVYPPSHPFPPQSPQTYNGGGIMYPSPQSLSPAGNSGYFPSAPPLSPSSYSTASPTY